MRKKLTDEEKRELNRVKCSAQYAKNKAKRLRYQKQYSQSNGVKIREYARQRYQKKRDEMRADQRQRYHADPAIKERLREYRQTDESRAYHKAYYQANKAKMNDLKTKWRGANPEKCRAIRRKQMQDPGQRLIAGLRSYLCAVIRARSRKVTKAAKTLELIGCTRQFLVGWIEAQFTRGMKWESYGKWDVDHIKPVSAFDHSDPAQQRLCWHYTNLRPMWKVANIQKGDKIVPFPAVNLDLFAMNA